MMKLSIAPTGRHRLRPKGIEVLWRLGIAMFCTWAYLRLAIVPDVGRVAQVIFTWIGWPFLGLVWVGASSTFLDWMK
jgi:hypothetical protein